MKRTVALIIAIVTIFASMSVFAEQIVTVKLDGNPIEFDVPAQIINDRTMVPMRKIFETLGAHVDWIEAQQGIVATKDSKIIIMKIGAKILLCTDIAKGEEKKIDLDVPPMIVGDRTLVPLRAVSESLDVNVEWVEETQTVELTSK